MALAVAVFDVQPGEIRFEQGGDLFGDVHAAVLAAGAADANGEVSAVAALDEGGQPVFQVGGGVGVPCLKPKDCRVMMSAGAASPRTVRRRSLS